MTRTPRALSLALLLVSLGAAAQQQPDAIRPDLIRERVTYLASAALAGRASGTPGNEAAARYVAHAFARAHLKPLGTAHQTDARAPLDGSGYFQPFTFASGVAPGKSNRLEAAVRGKPVRYRPGVEFEPSEASASGKAEGEVVFAGYGIDSRNPARDDYGGIDVKGKVVLVLAGSPSTDPHSPWAQYGSVRRKALYARDRGASALLVVLARSSDSPHMNGDGFTRDSGLPIIVLRRSIAEAWLRAGGRALADVERALAAGAQAFATDVRVKTATDVQKVTRTTANVAGLLEGSDPTLRDEVIVVGAHLDHLGMGGPGSLATDPTPAIHPGADDNASGTAGVMALADHFAAAPVRPKRSIVLICFSGEELGLLGSQHYASRPLVPLERTVAMLNMDMIGRMQGNRLIVVGSGTSPAWNPLLEDANRAVGLTLMRNEGEFGASDHHSFYAQRVPVLFFFTGIHPDYHRPSDTADKINADGEAQVVRLAAACVERVADTAERPAFVQVTPQQPSGPGRYRVSLGTIPDFTAEVEGVQISGVRPGSPAERAGLRGGDIIVKLGERSVRNLEDMTTALGEHKPGDVVAVVVRRGGQALTLTATLAPGTR